MSDFNKFKQAIDQQLTKMMQYPIFETDMGKEAIWDMYLASFAPGTDPIYKERTEHDCQCCKQFIRNIGNIVAIDDNYALMTIWDVIVDDPYQVVADALATAVKKHNIVKPYLHYEASVGTDHNHQQLEDGSIKTWNHFHYDLPGAYVAPKDDIPSKLSKYVATHAVFLRSLETITLDSLNIVLEMIQEKSLYKGDEYRETVSKFKQLKKTYSELDTKIKPIFTWKHSGSNGSRIRNSVIGTLLVDISEGIDLTEAVNKYGFKVDPVNFKVTDETKVTTSMRTKAVDKIRSLGLEKALQRRYAVTDDVTINNVIYADKSVRKQLDALDQFIAKAPSANKKLNNLTEIDLNTFLKEVVPTASCIEVLLENSHTNSLMSLIAPTELQAPNMLAWDNNFSWSYNGEVTDSMSDRVRAAGGKTDGVLRYSIQWNEEGDNNIDFDAHCYESNRTHIYYTNAKKTHLSSGMLDVDITQPNGKIAVENIIYTDKSKMRKGVYLFKLHNYSSRTSYHGFTAEIEFDGVIHSYHYPKKLRGGEFVPVATVTLDQNGKFTIENHINSEQQAKEVWGIQTNKFHKVNMIMDSPNHWDDQKIGNKHLFFVLDQCINPDQSRGFYNEFLRKDLHDHRKAFQVLGSMMKTEESDNQLSGLGFSSTKRNKLTCKVTGTHTRTFTINL